MTTSKGGPATGSVRWRFNHDPEVRKFVWWDRGSQSDGSRPWVPLDPSIRGLRRSAQIVRRRDGRMAER
jgi:hypothetical protein